MPYTTPDGFFDKIEDNIWAEVKSDYQAEDGRTVAIEARPGRKPAKLHLFVLGVMAVAASIALLVVVNMNFFKSDNASINDVDQAFSQLTTDDQAYLLTIYQDDVFINE